MSPDDPARMSADERMEEVAAILAAEFLRLKRRTVAAWDGSYDPTTGAHPTSANQNQTTAYTFGAAGHTLSLTAVLPGTDHQITAYTYGVNTGTIASNDLLASVAYPDKSTGNASVLASDQNAFTYNALGETLTKVDQNGTTHTYSFDLLGRMTADAVTLASGNPQNVDASVLRIETSYNTQGLAGTITSFDATSGGNITNQVQNVYNGLGQLTTQYQEHAGAVNTSTSLHVDYGYSDLAHGARLASLTYPNGRVLTYNYGTSSSLDDSISRLTSISDGNTTLESYAYLGLGTVVERDHPESGANLTYIKLTGESDGDAGDQYTGLDRFSRVVDQRWIDGSGTALDRYGYTYDRNSNRLIAASVR